MGVILVATDGSRAATAALDEAISLAAETGDEIAATTVWRALQGDFGLAYPSTAMLDDLLDAERTHAEVTLGDAAARAKSAGVGIRTRLTAGDPAQRICAYAEEVDARLIAIGRRGHGTVAALLLGSVSDAVIRHAPCPVLVVHEPERTADRDRTSGSSQPPAEPPRDALRRAHDSSRRPLTSA
jgi:nucleotide-binding universal stress UspA family protein